ncbi:phospholipase D3/4, partial [Paragonimus westermani]
TSYDILLSLQGKEIFNTLLNLSEKIQVNIAQSGSKKEDPELDAMIAAGARVYWIDVAKLLGQGIIHSKLWIADSKHAYLGSANMDWRSLTEVKELGVLYTNCSIIASDLEKVHETYRIVSTGIPPTVWPTTVWTKYNLTNPMVINLNGIKSTLYFSSSPPEFNPPGRTCDLEAILNTIRKAKKFIYLSVMNYSPEIVSYHSEKKNKFWPVIDNALRSAAIDRGLEVRLLISMWPHTPKTMRSYLSSLKAVDGIGRGHIRVRYFIVPSFTREQKLIPYARVNHNKYMVTDNTGYIGKYYTI